MAQDNVGKKSDDDDEQWNREEERERKSFENKIVLAGSQHLQVSIRWRH
jgi:hypothetical protein